MSSCTPLNEEYSSQILLVATKGLGVLVYASIPQNLEPGSVGSVAGTDIRAMAVLTSCRDLGHWWSTAI